MLSGMVRNSPSNSKQIVAVKVPTCLPVQVAAVKRGSCRAVVGVGRTAWDEFPRTGAISRALTPRWARMDSTYRDSANIGQTTGRDVSPLQYQTILQMPLDAHCDGGCR
jgi:hypothetical protein